MSKTLIDVIMYLFEGALIYYYSDSLFALKRSKGVRIAVISCVTALLFFVYRFNITYLNTVLFVLLYCGLLYFLYRISFKTAVFHSVMLAVVMFASEIMVMAAGTVLFNDFNAMENSFIAYLFLVITSKVLYFGFTMIILKLFAIKENREQNNKYYWMLFIVPLVSILVLLSFRYISYQIRLTNTMSVLWTVSCIGILFANVLVFAQYEFSLKNEKELFELKTVQQREEQDKRYFEIIEQSNKDMRIFSHDIKNHLTQIRNLETTEEVRKYIDSVFPQLEKFSFIGVSKNKMLDLIISKYATLCEGKNIKFYVDVKTANLSYISDADLSGLMNNLLDNAVEAAEKAENPFIDMRIFSKNNMYDGLVIKNGSAVSPKTENGELKTTKSNKKIHGMGSKSIKKTVKKYGGVYGWKYDEDLKIFETDIVFPKKDGKEAS